MKKLVFIERKFWGFVSIEKVFEQLAHELSPDPFKIEFQKVSYDNNLIGVIKNLLWFRRKPADIYHLTGHIHYLGLVLPRDRTVLTIHDLGFLHIRRGLRRFVLKKLYLDWPIRRLRYVTAISATTKNEILRYTNCDADKIVVIENPLQKQYLRKAEPKFNAAEPTILQIGTLPNKNVARLAEALAGIKCRLRIVGRIDETLRNFLNRAEIVYENVCDLDDDQMRAEYENADIVSFCSTYEGFGMPVIEAQSVGRAVLTSNLSPMREVAGKGAYLADPYDPADIRAGIRLIIENRDFREKLISAGFDNVRRFHPALIAASYRNLYVHVLSELGEQME